MKYILLIPIILASSFLSAHAQEPTGVWLTENNEAKIKIYQAANGSFEGIIIWTKDQSEKSKKTIGQRILSTFKKKNKNTFEGGTINHLQQGKKYNGIITMLNSNTLKLRGYIGNPMLGVSQIWTKTTP